MNLNLPTLCILALGYYFIFVKKSPPSTQQIESGAQTAASVIQDVYQQAKKASAKAN